MIVSNSIATFYGLIGFASYFQPFCGLFSRNLDVRSLRLILVTCMQEEV